MVFQKRHINVEDNISLHKIHRNLYLAYGFKFLTDLDVLEFMGGTPLASEEEEEEDEADVGASSPRGPIIAPPLRMRTPAPHNVASNLLPVVVDIESTADPVITNPAAAISTTVDPITVSTGPSSSMAPPSPPTSALKKRAHKGKKFPMPQEGEFWSSPHS